MIEEDGYNNKISIAENAKCNNQCVFSWTLMRTQLVLLLLQCLMPLLLYLILFHRIFSILDLVYLAYDERNV